MFGTNAIRKKEPFQAAPRYQVTDIWYTIQGEGPHMGKPAMFVRFSGCTLACFFCDTKWDDNAEYISLEEIVDTIVRRTPPRCDLIVFTGGEPLRQDLAPLFYQLRKRFEEERGYAPHLQIETSGSIWDPALDAFPSEELTVVVSPKTPTLNSLIEARADAYKYVIDAYGISETDGLPVVSTQQEGKKAHIARPTRSHVPIYVSPMDVQDEAQNKVNTMTVGRIALVYGYRVSLQMHKILELP